MLHENLQQLAAEVAETPQTNGMVERFNGRISDILKTSCFDSSRELLETMKSYLKIYNYYIPQKNIDHLTPIQKLKEWYKKKPELFKKNVYDLSGLDSLPSQVQGRAARHSENVICLKLAIVPKYGTII